MSGYNLITSNSINAQLSKSKTYLDVSILKEHIDMLGQEVPM